jgi:hypothetical protein
LQVLELPHFPQTDEETSLNMEKKSTRILQERVMSKIALKQFSISVLNKCSRKIMTLLRNFLLISIKKSVSEQIAFFLKNSLFKKFMKNYLSLKQLFHQFWAKLKMNLDAPLFIRIRRNNWFIPLPVHNLKSNQAQNI